MRIAFIGSGIRPEMHLTLESIAALKESKKVLCLGDFTDIFHRLNINHYEDIRDLYLNGNPDHENYKVIFEKIIKEMKIYDEIAVIVPGHPRVGVTLLQWLEKAQTKMDFTLNILEGISSFDTMMNDIMRDPLETGTLLLDANRFLLFNYDLDPHLDLYLYHVCSIGTNKTHYMDAKKENRFDLLQNRLLKFYPLEHSAFLISSADHSSRTFQKYCLELSRLTNALEKVHFASTLFIPGIALSNIDSNFFKLITHK